MSDVSEGKNNPLRGDVPATFPDGRLARAAHTVWGNAPGINRGHQPVKQVPFNGLLSNKLLTGLPGADFARLLPHLEPVSVACGQHLYEQEAAADFAYFPETAVLSHIYFLEDGSTTEAALIGREGMVGLSAVFGSRPPTYWTEVTVAGTALRIRPEVLKQEFARSEALQRLLLAYTGARMAQLSQRAVCNCRHTVDERLCSWLLMIHDRVGDDPLPLTHEEIARHLGTRRAGITGACAALRDNRIISYSRGLIHVVDRRGLEAAACECYRALRRAVE